MVKILKFVCFHTLMRMIWSKILFIFWPTWMWEASFSLRGNNFTMSNFPIIVNWEAQWKHLRNRGRNQQVGHHSVYCAEFSARKEIKMRKTLSQDFCSQFIHAPQHLSLRFWIQLQWTTALLSPDLTTFRI